MISWRDSSTTYFTKKHDESEVPMPISHELFRNFFGRFAGKNFQNFREICITFQSILKIGFREMSHAPTSCSAVFQQGSFTVEKEREKERENGQNCVGIIEREATSDCLKKVA